MDTTLKPEEKKIIRIDANKRFPSKEVHELTNAFELGATSERLKANEEIERLKEQSELLIELKTKCVNTFRKKGDKNALIFKGKRKFTGNEIANEIEIESIIGVQMVNSLLQLTIDLLMRDKLNQELTERSAPEQQ